MREVPRSEGYILTTAAKNEERNLPKAAKGIISQTITPKLWVIVDDGSTDRTPEIIQDLKKQRDWIVGTSLPGHGRDIQLHYAEVCKKAFDFAVRYLDQKGIDYEFVGLVDADTIVEPGYFEKLMDEFKKDSKLGVASGGLFYEKGGTLVLESGDKISPRGTGRLWRKKCFFDTGGYMACQAPPDTISNVKAKILGYGVKQFQRIVAVQLRATSSAEGMWAGFEKKGKSWHYMNAHPVLIMMNVIHFTLEPPRYRGLAFLLGYTIALVRRESKIEDEEIKQYFWGRRPREVLQSVASERGNS